MLRIGYHALDLTVTPTPQGFRLTPYQSIAYAIKTLAFDLYHCYAVNRLAIRRLRLHIHPYSSAVYTTLPNAKH